MPALWISVAIGINTCVFTSSLIIIVTNLALVWLLSMPSMLDLVDAQNSL